MTPSFKGFQGADMLGWNVMVFMPEGDEMVDGAHDNTTVTKATAAIAYEIRQSGDVFASMP